MADAYNWTYGNGDAVELAAAGTHVYTYAGEEEPMDYTLTLTATHALGCTDAMSNGPTRRLLFCPRSMLRPTLGTGEDHRLDVLRLRP